MNRFRSIAVALFAPALLLLAACAGGLAAASTAAQSLPTILGGPVTVSDRTTIDETAGRSIELAYKAARTVAEIAVDAGLLKGDRAAKAQVLNRRAYDAVLAARAAYRAGNETSWIRASAEARTAIEQFLAAAKGS
jgi:hypothetical protein